MEKGGIELNKIYCGDALKILKTWPDEFVDCVVTSPPYWGLRDYGVGGQLGLEKTPEEYVIKMVEVFREVKRVLKKEGTLWLNLGDTYSGSGNGSWNIDNPEMYGKQFYKNKSPKEFLAKPRTWKGLPSKNIVGIPWRVAFALQADGWYLRQDIIWAKPNPMPESVTDRCTKSHEYIFLLTKSPKYYFDAMEIMEPSVTQENRPDGIIRDRIYDYDSKLAVIQKRKRKNGVGIDDGKGKNGEYGFNCGVRAYRNKRSVWTVTTKPFKEAHFATFPSDLITPMILAGGPEKGIVLDPFMGSGTTAYVARSLGRNFLGIELNPSYIKMAERRLAQKTLL